MLDRVYPVVPKKLPDGKTVWEEQGKAADVRDAVKGFDPRMSLIRNFVDEAWEVWRSNEDGSDARVGLYPGDRLPEPREILDDLYGHDCWRGYDPIAALELHEWKRQAAEDYALDQIIGATTDRIHYEMVDEWSAHMPATRPMYLSPRGRLARRGRAHQRDRGPVPGTDPLRDDRRPAQRGAVRDVVRTPPAGTGCARCGPAAQEAPTFTRSGTSPLV
jgi:hypothetical protein